MGLNVSIYRSGYDSSMNVFYGKKGICLTNVEGPFNPSEDYPAGKVEMNRQGNLRIVPDDNWTDKEGVQMDGGTFGYTSDSRFAEHIEGYFALPIHDRRENWEQYEAMSR